MLIAPIHGYIDSHVGYVVFILLYFSFIVLNFSTSIKFGVKIREFVNDRYFWLIFFLFWILFNLIVLSAFSGNLRFSGFDEIYEQREFAKTSVTSTYVWYSSGFLANCFNPFLISYGLSYNKKVSFIIGSAGQIFLFATAAQKIVIATIPLIIIFYIFVINKKGIKLYNIGFITAAACLSFLPVYYILNPDSQMGNIIQNLTSLVYLRTFCVPGAMLSIYVDYFSNSDLTYYSHSMAGALFSKYPYDAPVGEVIGGYVLNGLRYVNYNAGFFATDGVASLGIFGIVAASILVSYFLIFILIIFGKKEMNVVCGSFIPFTAALSNSSIFTSLLTGGGIVLIIILFFWISVKKGE
ncbi:hypothetical protein ACUJ46_05180 [Sandaracinobacteroides sp. A072]|uniref:hypothetical protein n=1 Tax=Sandaracinobacteroides sp. A072 TaxID=3461146 RepID=UPI00404119D7